MGFVKNVGDRIRRFLGDKEDEGANSLSKSLAIGPNTAMTGGLLGDMGYKTISDILRVDSDVLSRFVDYEDMDNNPILSQALNIYADETTQIDSEKQTAMWVVTDDQNLKVLIEDLLYRVLKVDYDLWEKTRTLCKYGTDYSEILYGDSGVVGLKYLPVASMRRIEDEYGTLLGFIQTFSPSFGYTKIQYEQFMALKKAGKPVKDDKVTSALPSTAFEWWEVMQLRLKGKYRNSMYGTSILEPARFIYKRLQILEDSAILYRLQRSPERLAFFIETGNLPANEALAAVNRVKLMHKKRRFIDPATGKLTISWEPFGVDEDYYIPTRQGVDSTRIQQITAPQWSSMDDIEYFKNLMFGALGIPKAYLAEDQGVARAVLSSEDVRFARSILRIQQEIKKGYEELIERHLVALGIDPDVNRYKLEMTVPNSIFELSQLEVKNARADLAARIGAYVSTEYILKNIFKMTDDEIAIIREQQLEDAERMAEIAKLTGEAAPTGTPASPAPSPVPSVPQVTGAPTPDTAGGEQTPPSTMPTPPPPTQPAAQSEWIKARREMLRRTYGAVPLFENKKSTITPQLESKINKIINNDKEVSTRLKEINGLLRDIISTQRK